MPWQARHSMIQVLKAKIDRRHFSCANRYARFRDLSGMPIDLRYGRILRGNNLVAYGLYLIAKAD